MATRSQEIGRRAFCAIAGAALVSPLIAPSIVDAAKPLPNMDDKEGTTGDFKLNYILGSCMYGYTKLAEILPEVAKTGATAIDIWPKVHGDQREQLDEIGEEAFAKLLKKHGVTLGCLTQYHLGPFGLKDEMQLAKRLGCSTIVTGAVGAKGLIGDDLKKGVVEFCEKMKPHLEVAEETGVTIAIENHANNLMESADAMKWLAELRPSKSLAIAFAPAHLDQDSLLLGRLIKSLGEAVAVFYAWQKGQGFMSKMPKPKELEQMPGRGSLDFEPLLRSLREIQYTGLTEIFMHPTPRGEPILASTEQVTDEINRGREYLEKLIAE